ncbi:DUF4259 domain-containing protein [Streptomyces sp. NPDC001985]|uniref:DUF4259 domain-containing protein n=1 Tax=Streptomyces sp. NPDC001985 TaxID=3154406 RepID=UPI003325F640
MGTWGTGPFDSGLVVDFVDELAGQQVMDVLGRAFQRVTDSGERVDGQNAVASFTSSRSVCLLV